MFHLIEHIHQSDGYEFIDKSKLGATGHSMGGNAAIRGANYFGKKAKSDGRESILNSVYVSGYVLTLQDNVLRPIKSNMGVSYALYDEGAFRNELQGWEAADMRIAPESLRTVNAVLDKSIEKKLNWVNITEILQIKLVELSLTKNCFILFSPTMLKPQLINCLTLTQFLVLL